jgi:hypothetical protein
VVNNFFRSYGHLFLYDPPTLQATMEGAGFSDVTRWLPGESNDKNYREIESHGKIIGAARNRFETMVLEAIRPSSSKIT